MTTTSHVDAVKAHAELTATIASMGTRTRVYAPPAGFTSHLAVARGGAGFIVQIGGKLTGEARAYALASEVATVIEHHRHTSAGKRVSASL
jgi:hypothetical protein